MSGGGQPPTNVVRLSLFPTLKPARQVVLEGGRDYLVGRGSDCDLSLDDDRISRRHARLSPGETGWLVADLGSKNGTSLDGRPVIEPVPLHDGAWLSFGGLPARFEVLKPGDSERQTRQRLERWADTWTGSQAPVVGEDLCDLPRRLLHSILELSGAERGFVLLARPDGDLEVAASEGLSPEELASRGFSGSAAAVERVLATGEPLVVCDARDDSLLGSRPSVVGEGIRALLCLPLEARGSRLGAAYADSRRPGTTFTELDLEILRAMSSHAALAFAVEAIDRELRALAGRIAAEAGIESPLRERLRRETEAAWERALHGPAGSTATAGGTTWASLRASHREPARGSA